MLVILCGAYMKRILVVDDDPGIVELVSRGLKRSDYEAKTADGGKACLEMYDEFKPDLILLDIMMPDLNGWEVLGKLADEHDIHDSIIVMLTAKPLDEEDVKRDSFEFVSHYLMKPFGMEDLIMEIEMVFEEEEKIRDHGMRIMRSFGREIGYSYLEYLKLASRRQRIITGMMGEDIPGSLQECPAPQGMDDVVHSIENITQSLHDIESELQSIRSRISTFK